MTMPRVAIIGAGLAGTVAGETLAAAGVAVSLFDMGRKSGGRASTRLEMNKHDSRLAKEEMIFDHGLPFLHMATTVGKQEPRYTERIKRWHELGFLEVWEGRFGCLKNGEYSARSADMQDMSDSLQIFGLLADSSMTIMLPKLGMGGLFDQVIGNQGLQCRIESQQGMTVKSITKRGSMWSLRVSRFGEDDQDFDGFDWVIFADKLNFMKRTPGYVEGSPCSVVSILEKDEMINRPLFSLMMAFDKYLEELPFDGAVMDPSTESNLLLFVRNTNKPGRKLPPRIKDLFVAVCTPKFSKRLLHCEPSSVADRKSQGPWMEVVAEPLLFAEVERELVKFFQESNLPHPYFMKAQRWRSALSPNCFDPFYCIDFSELHSLEEQWVCCGDWTSCDGTLGAEAAVVTGIRAAEIILQTLS